MNASPSRRLAGRLGWTGLRALNRTGRLSRAGLTADVRLGGRSVTVPLWSGLGLDHGAIPDPHLVGVIRALLELRTGAFVDVGAHLGQTLVKLLVIGDPRPYLGFEPKPRAAAYVEALLAANGRSGDAVLAAAAGDVAGTALLAVAGDLDDAASVVGGGPERPSPGRSIRPVPVVRGDDALIVTGLETVGLLKIDAEGHELEVVRGFEAAIARDRPPILCEILPFGPRGDAASESRRRRAAELESVLAGLGYAMLACGSDGRARRVQRAADERGFEEREFVFVQENEIARLGDRIAST